GRAPGRGNDARQVGVSSLTTIGPCWSIPCWSVCPLTGGAHRGGTCMLEVFGLSETAECVYEAMLRTPGLGVVELAAELVVPEGVIRGALDELAAAMLVRSSRERSGV